EQLGDIAYRPAGGLHVLVADDPVEPADLIAYRRERGFVAELASPGECARLIPGLTANIKGGVRSPRPGPVDPILTMAALARAAPLRSGRPTLGTAGRALRKGRHRPDDAAHRPAHGRAHAGPAPRGRRARMVRGHCHDARPHADHRRAAIASRARAGDGLRRQ